MQGSIKMLVYDKGVIRISYLMNKVYSEDIRNKIIFLSFLPPSQENGEEMSGEDCLVSPLYLPIIFIPRLIITNGRNN